MPPTPQEASDLYARWVSRTGLSENTKKVYIDRVRSFLAWMIEQGPEYAEAMVDEHVRDYAAKDYRRKLLVTDKRAPSTVAQHISAITSFFEWVGIGKPNGVSVDVPPSQKKGLDESDLRKVLRACQRRGPRDYALGRLMFESGIRAEECASLDVDDIHMTERTGKLHVRYGKGGRPRDVPLSAAAREALKGWEVVRPTMRGSDTSKALFLSTRGDRLAVRSIQDMLARAGAEVGVHVTPHVLRHTFGRRSVENGTDLEALRQLLGHKNIQTTAGYTRPRWDNLEEAVERVGIEL